MIARERVVVGTSALVSRLLFPNSVPAQAVHRALVERQVLASDATIMELADVLGRQKFDAYVTIAERQEFLRVFAPLPNASLSYISCVPAAIRETTSFWSSPSMARRA